MGLQWEHQLQYSNLRGSANSTIYWELVQDNDDGDRIPPGAGRLGVGFERVQSADGVGKADRDVGAVGVVRIRGRLETDGSGASAQHGEQRKKERETERARAA